MNLRGKPAIRMADKTHRTVYLRLDCWVLGIRILWSVYELSYKTCVTSMMNCIYTVCIRRRVNRSVTSVPDLRRNERSELSKE